MNDIASQKSWPVSAGYRLIRYLLPLIILFMPALMFHFMLPFTDTQISPGRDFSRFYMWQQLENMISVKFGSFPIYIPGDGGSSFASLSAGYAQLYLPLPYLASLLPGYWTGYAYDWVLLINLLAISAAHLALFYFLRRLDLSRLSALALSTLTVYTPRILVSLGYGAGIAAWTGHLFLCVAMGFYFLRPTRVRGPLLIIAAAYWLINSGHPAEVYFGMLGAWLFILVLPGVVETVLPDHHRTFGEKCRFWVFCGGCCAVAFLLSSAYIMPLYMDVLPNMDFADMSLAQAATTTDTAAGLIYNFFLPIRSGLFGGFAGTSLYLAVILMPLLKIFRVPVGRGGWLVFIAIGVVFLYMTGESTPVFSALWKLLPFASHTRNPARASLMLPVIFMLALVWLFKTRAAICFSIKGRRLSIPARTALGLAGVLLLPAGLIALDAASPALFAFVQLNALFIPDWVEPLIIATGLLSLVFMAAHGLTIRRQTATEIVLCVIICLHLALLMRYGSAPFAVKHENDVITLEKITAQKTRTLKGIPEYLFLFEAASHKEEVVQIENYFLEPHLGQIFREYLPAKDRADAYRILNDHRRRDEVVLEGFCPDKYPVLTAAGCEGEIDRVQLTYSTYNRLVFEAEACQPAIFVLSYPDPDNQWSAQVNGAKAPVYTANGLSQAVVVPSGISTIEFRFWSRAAFAGMMTSCLTLALLGGLAGFRSGGSPRTRLIMAVLFIGPATGLFFVWFGSLHSGRSFNTEYTWQTPTPKSLSNLAYGKPTEISAYSTVHTPYLHSRRGVDGDNSFYSCMITAYHRNPWFKIDLKEVSTVGSIVITTSLQGYEDDKMVFYFYENVAATAIDGIFVFEKVPVLFNNLPLIIAVSKDDENWEYAGVDHITPNIPHLIQFEEPAEIRYVKIIANGVCRLSLNEVEVYPPEEEGF